VSALAYALAPSQMIRSVDASRDTLGRVLPDPPDRPHEQNNVFEVCYLLRPPPNKPPHPASVNSTLPSSSFVPAITTSSGCPITNRPSSLTAAYPPPSRR